jgi:hypothetical protein
MKNKNTTLILISFFSSLIPLVVSLIVFVDKIPLKNTEESWKFFASLIGFILSLILFNTVVLSIFLLKFIPKIKLWLKENSKVEI